MVTDHILDDGSNGSLTRRSTHADDEAFDPGLGRDRGDRQRMDRERAARGAADVGRRRGRRRVAALAAAAGRSRVRRDRRPASPPFRRRAGGDLAALPRPGSPEVLGPHHRHVRRCGKRVVAGRQVQSDRARRRAHPAARPRAAVDAADVGRRNQRRRQDHHARFGAARLQRGRNAGRRPRSRGRLRRARQRSRLRRQGCARQGGVRVQHGRPETRGGGAAC